MKARVCTLACVAVIGLLSGLGTAHATKPALRLERIDPQGFATEGKVKLFASIVELEGQIDDGKQSFSLKLDGRKTLRPERVEPFVATALPLDVVLVIESSALYGVQQLPKNGTLPTGDVPLDRVKDALASFLENRSGRTRVLVVDYGGDVTPHVPFRPANAVQGALDALYPDGESGDLRLVDAVQAALVELSRVHGGEDEHPPRRLIVLVSDGLNASMDRKTFRALGDAAAKARVPIHAIAFSPADDRGPLLNLGELSKRSNGTFRWARSADDLKLQIDTLADELDKQYVLTFALPIDSLEGHTFQLTCETLVSNILRYDSGGSVFGYTGATSRRSKVWLVLEWVGGVLCGVVVLWLGFGVVLRLASRNKRPAATLELLDGPRAGQRIALSLAPTILGKGGPIVVDDAAVSTRHCQLGFDGRGWLLTDLDSTNGTWVDGQRIAGPVYLQPGQILHLGQTRLRLSL
ncbi:MAG: FHA domain-containing protein [Polyangia bacterium]